MSFLLTETLESRIVEVTVSSKLTKEVYLEFIQTTEAATKKNGTIRVLFLMLGFNGWNAGAIWDDIESEMNHFDHIERVAIVGETKWKNGALSFSRPFTAAIIKYFEQSDLDKAREWIYSSSA